MTEKSLRVYIRHLAQQEIGSTSPLSEIMAEGEYNILTLRLLGFMHYILKWCGAWTQHVVISLIAMSVFPLLHIAEISLLNNGSVENVYCSIYFSVVIVIYLLFPRVAWRWLASASQDIEDVIREKSANSAYTSMLRRRLDIRRQLTISIPFGFFLCAILLTMSPYFMSRINFQYTSYVQIFVCGMLLSNAVYWIALVPQLIRSVKNLQLHLLYLEPARTPGIQSLGKVLSKSSLLSLVALIVSIAPAFYYAYITRSKEISILADAGLLAGSFIVFYILLAPQFWLKDIVDKQKDRSLIKIDATIRQMIARSEPPQQIEASIKMYEIIKSSGSWVVDIKGIFNYISLFGTAVAPGIKLLFP